MRVNIAFLILLAFAALYIPPARADQVDEQISAAFKLCAALENTGMTTSCEVKGYGGTVDTRIDTNGGEARKICSGIVSMMGEQTPAFRNSRWKLRIFSPYSGDQPIAVCKLG